MALSAKQATSCHRSRKYITYGRGTTQISCN